MRKNRDANIPVVVRKKVTTRQSTEAKSQISPKTKKHHPAYGVKKYFSSCPIAEDKESIQRRRKRMKLESSRKFQDFRSIELGMERMFGDRKTWIVDDNPSVTKIKKEYPCLFDTVQVS